MPDWCRPRSSKPMNLRASVGLAGSIPVRFRHIIRTRQSAAIHRARLGTARSRCSCHGRARRVVCARRARALGSARVTISLSRARRVIGEAPVEVAEAANQVNRSSSARSSSPVRSPITRGPWSIYTQAGSLAYVGGRLSGVQPILRLVVEGRRTVRCWNIAQPLATRKRHLCHERHAAHAACSRRAASRRPVRSSSGGWLGALRIHDAEDLLTLVAVTPANELAVNVCANAHGESAAQAESRTIRVNDLRHAVTMLILSGRDGLNEAPIAAPKIAELQHKLDELMGAFTTDAGEQNPPPAS